MATPAPSQRVDQYYAEDSVQPFSPGAGTRWNPSISGASGYRDVVIVEEGFEIVVGDVRHEQPATITVAERGVVKFHFRLSGTGRAALQGGEQIDIPERSWSLLVHPDGIAKQEWFFAGQHERSVTLLCSADFLRSRAGDIAANLPAALKGYLSGEEGATHQQILPLRADMAQAAASLLACELTGSLRLLYAEARGFELLTLALQSLLDVAAGRNSQESGLSSSDERKVHDARTYLEENFLDPPTVNELAAVVEMNEAKLMRAFKHTIGATLFDFAQQLRMERAKKLLETTDLTVTTIAMEVGYEYSSNFTTAFKRHFGVTPRAARDAANPK